MEDVEPDPQLAQLTAEMAWVRRMARALVRGDDAEDVAQDACVIAVERRPADDRPLRPWLGRVVLNLARMRSRGRLRREARETASADLVEPVTRPDDLVQRVELQRLVAGEVLKLAEPYRSTVLMHYFEELTCAEIARRLAVPEGTVRRRLKVALDEVRAGIDAQERRSGLAVLAPLAGLGPTSPGSTVVGVIAMKKLLAALAVLIVLLIVVVWKRDGEGTRAPPPTERAGTVSATVPAGAAALDPQLPSWLVQRDVKPRRIAGRVTFRGAPLAGATVELASVASEAGVATAPRRTTNAAGEFDFGAQAAIEWSVRGSAPGKASAVVDVDLRDPTTHADRIELELGACTAAMFGTIRDASGGPIANARIARIPADASGVPGGPSVASDAKGAYELCVETRWPGLVVVEVSADGYAAITLRSVVPGRMKMDFALVPEATITGRVVRDDTGEPVPQAYVFVAGGRPGVESTPPRATFSDPSGRFRIDRLAAGRHLVFARAGGMVESSVGVPVTIGVGQSSAEIEIRLEEGSLLRGRVVDGDKPIAGAHVVALDSVGPRANAVSQDDGTFVLAGVPRGEIRFTAFPYEVERPETFQVSQATHDGITIEVESRGTIIGTAVRGKRPVPGAAIDIHGPNDNELSEVRADANGRFEVHGLRAGPWTLFASDERQGAFGRAPETVQLARGATAEVTIDIAYAAAISGRVVDQNGNPVPGVAVMFENTNTDDVGVTATADDGTFRAAMMTGGGAYRPVVRRSLPSRIDLRPASGTEFPLVTLDKGDAEVTGIVLAVQLDRLAIAGKVVDSDGAPVPDARVVADLVVANQPPRFVSGLQHPADTSDVTGHFTIDDLLAGTYAVRARSANGVEALVQARAGQGDVTVVLPTPGTIEVTTTGFATTPQVTAVRTDMFGAEAPASATAQGANVFAFRNLSPGSYVLAARSASEAASATVQVTAGRTSRVTLASAGSGVVAGIVRDFRTQAPIEGMTCRAIPRQGIEAVPASLGEGARTDARGAFLISAAPAGQIAIWCDGLWRNYSNGLRMITLQASQRADVTVPVVAWTQEAGTTLGNLGADFDPQVLVPRLVGVKPGGAAATAGFVDGDIVIAVDDVSVTELSPRGVNVLVVNRPPGSHVRVSVTRGGKTVNGDVVLGTK